MPPITDAYCPFCRELLNDPEQQIAAGPNLATGSALDLKADDNPYAAVSSGSKNSRRAGLILYTELPRRCPACDKKFSEANFRLRFKPKMRWMTISYMLLVGIGSWALLSLLLPFILFWPVFLLIVIPVLGNAMTWPKIVKMSCSGCKWKKGFMVARAGAK